MLQVIVKCLGITMILVAGVLFGVMAWVFVQLKDYAMTTGFIMMALLCLIMGIGAVEFMLMDKE
jgi:hypothetical protein